MNVFEVNINKNELENLTKQVSTSYGKDWFTISKIDYYIDKDNFDNDIIVVNIKTKISKNDKFKSSQLLIIKEYVYNWFKDKILNLYPHIKFDIS